MVKNNYIYILAFLCLSMVIFHPAISYAQSGDEKKNAREQAANEKKKKAEEIHWEIHKSITNIFETKFPQKYKYKIFPFQFNNNTVAFTLEIAASLDKDTAGKKEKSILVKAMQTFGEELSYREVENILTRETQKYKQAAKAMGGKLLTNENIKHDGFLGKKFYISYKSKGITYGLRIIVYITNYSKIEQVLSGPANSMFSYRAGDFFDSMKLYDGITKKENPLGVAWVEYPSKNNIFTAVLPPKNSDYTPTLPEFSATPKRGKMTFQIYDPVRMENVKYNIYSYKNNKKFSKKQIQSILFSGHISKFVKNAGADNLKTENKIIDGVTTMRTKLIITPTKEFPDVTTVFFEAKFKDNILVVQEFLSGNAHANSKLNRTLFSLMKFHPEKYKAVETEKQPKKRPPDEKAK